MLDLSPETIALLREQHDYAKMLEADLDYRMSTPSKYLSTTEVAQALTVVLKGLIALQETLIEAAEEPRDDA